MASIVLLIFMRVLAKVARSSLTSAVVSVSDSDRCSVANLAFLADSAELK